MRPFFRVTGPLCGEFTGPGEFPAQWPVTRSFDVFFDLRLNKRSSKQSWGWWFETPPWSLWRHCNGKSISKHQGLALLTLSWDKNWDSHSLVNGYPRFYPGIALVAPSPVSQIPQSTEYVQWGDTSRCINECLPSIFRRQCVEDTMYSADHFSL